ncbi:MAG: hypothetical protein CM1200mP24_09450 [Gammaproteobacteria bacterium]|nr:MAG: hypothetical protein CM1200mP24_09450 [Gammaproteobacteria bacterium]
MGEIGSWDPDPKMSEQHRDILDRAADAIDQPGLGMTQKHNKCLGVIQASPQILGGFCRTRDNYTNYRVDQSLTLIEEVLGVEVGAKSPVITLVRLLKKRNAFPNI